MDGIEPQPAAGGPSIILAVASAMAWVFGVLEVLSAVAVFVPMVALGSGQSPLVPAGLAALGSLLCAAGYLLRKRRKMGGILALGLVAFSVVARTLAGSLISFITVVIVALFVLVLVSWKELE